MNLKLLCITLLLIFSSCSLQKRLYNKGFYTSKHQSAKKITNDKDTLPSVAVNNTKAKSKNENLVVANAKLIPIPPVLITGCDTIVLQSGARIVANINEINQSQIKFKNCGSPHETEIAIKKADVSHILFANGTKETFTTLSTDEDKYLPQNISPDQNHGSSASQYNRGNKNYGDKKQNGFATAGFVLAIVSHPVAAIVTLIGAISTILPNATGIFPLNMLIIPFIIAFMAFVFCVIAIYQIVKNKESQKGLVIAIIGAFLSLLLMVILLLFYLHVLI